MEGDPSVYRRAELHTYRSAREMPALVSPNRGLLAVNLDGCVLLNIMITFAGENRELEAGDGN